jgi:membrane protein implicated in regulation of membrane protease activity
MRLLRGLAGALLWIVSSLLALVALILCVTIILLPLGVPLLGYARRLFTLSLKLMLPRALTHPVDTASESIGRRGRKAKDDGSAAVHDVKKLGKRGRKKARRLRKRIPLVH